MVLAGIMGEMNIWWGWILIPWLMPGAQGLDVSTCDNNHFEPSCPHQNEVILITNATYGRMRVGVCGTTSNHSIGCHVNVLGQLDEKCSGRSACDVRVTDNDLGLGVHASPCQHELKKYLHVQHECVTVISPTTTDCHSPAILDARPTTGHLSNDLTQYHQLCSDHVLTCILRAHPGQNIRWWVTDFGWGSARGHCGVNSSGEVVEPFTGQKFDVCGVVGRRSQDYVSIGNHLVINLSRGDTRFLVSFEAVGCAAPPVPGGGWLRRRGGQATGGCNDSDVTWVLHCMDGAWNNSLSNCTAAAAPITVMLFGLAFPKGVVVVLAAAAVVIVCAMVLCVGLLCWRRLHPRAPPLEAAVKYSTAPRSNGGSPYGEGRYFINPGPGPGPGLATSQIFHVTDYSPQEMHRLESSDSGFAGYNRNLHGSRIWDTPLPDLPKEGPIYEGLSDVRDDVNPMGGVYETGGRCCTCQRPVHGLEGRLYEPGAWGGYGERETMPGTWRSVGGARNQEGGVWNGVGGANVAMGGVRDQMGGANVAMGGVREPMGGVRDHMGGANVAMGGVRDQMGRANVTMGGVRDQIGGANVAMGGVRDQENVVLNPMAGAYQTVYTGQRRRSQDDVIDRQKGGASEQRGGAYDGDYKMGGPRTTSSPQMGANRFDRRGSGGRNSPQMGVQDLERRVSGDKGSSQAEGRAFERRGSGFRTSSPRMGRSSLKNAGMGMARTVSRELLTPGEWGDAGEGSEGERLGGEGRGRGEDRGRGEERGQGQGRGVGAERGAGSVGRGATPTQPYRLTLSSCSGENPYYFELEPSYIDEETHI